MTEQTPQFPHDRDRDDPAQPQGFEPPQPDQPDIERPAVGHYAPGQDQGSESAPDLADSPPEFEASATTSEPPQSAQQPQPEPSPQPGYGQYGTGYPAGYGAEYPRDYWAQGSGAGQQPGYYGPAGYATAPYPAYGGQTPYGQGGYPGYPTGYGPYPGAPGAPQGSGSMPGAGAPGGPGGPPAPGGPGQPRRPRQYSPRRTVLIAAVVAAIVGGGIGAGTVAATDNNSTPVASAGLSFSTQSAPAAKLDGSISAAAAKIGPSVVTINVRGAREADTGSGVIIRKDGYILTNNHVIAAAATANGGGAIQVVFKDGTTAKATISGRDPSDDLAVIKVSKTGLTPATFADSGKLTVGQTVVAVGAPLGLSDTVTSGIVSTLARPVTTGDSANNQATFNAIQTDAAINPGNSGGPLVDLNGDVVGINSAIATDQSQGGLQVPGSQPGNIGIGFAIPSNEAGRIANELITTGHATHAVMGVRVEGTANGAPGAAIVSVNPNSPAQKAGLTAGDVVTKFGGQLIANNSALVAAVRSHAPGSKVTLTYTRDGKSHTATMTLGTGTD